MTNQIKHNLKVGNILYSSWGYDQTNISLYKVVRLAGKTMVVLQELQGTRHYGEDHFMAGTITPNEDEFYKSEFKKKAVNDCVSIESYELAQLWDGKPKQFTSYA